MTTLRGIVSLPNSGGIPADTATNTWHFRTFEVDPVVGAEAAAVQLEGFYDSIMGIFASHVASPLEVKWYDLEDASPRVPILVNTMTITPGAGGNLPNEVAIACSYQGQAISGTPLARRRGRIFLGPLDAGVVDTAASDTIVSEATRNLIAGAAGSLVEDGESGDTAWAVFSPTTAGPEPWSPAEIIAATLPVLSGWVDNAFDTIRSRGSAATARSTFG